VWWVDATAESDAAMSYAWLDGAKHWLARTSSSCIASSSLSAAYLTELGADGTRIHESFLGIDPDSFAEAVEVCAASRADIARELGVEGRVVLYVGQLEPYKGVDLLFDACDLVAADEKISLLLVGAGALEEPLRERAARSSYCVVFAGFAQPGTLPKFYAIADVFCLLSRYEPFGVVVSEAVAAGLPVICSIHAGASGDLVRDGENGFVVDPEDAACVAECIRAVIGDPAANDRMRCNSIALSKKMDPTIAARGFVDAALHAVADREACCP
jgi:glycosyltransferase involved in cell wall biosynthesis